ncbi:DNA mismatch repair protein MutS [Planctomicrobium piriforme]|uniref:DNA mismatch repair protein MutS n=1 Tax=Planctomicrobium piriforme TaxID=1576369 RepID=A0A1I3IBU6_9PLAN|nr:DNA mismatch repair protein MutS [Planctomicrobium piriforme]SFI45253.1 DNA mismatch repair protein MutS [Planctomicrobium piriforme]
MSSTKDETKLTPMMQRYQEVKAETPGTILLFRMGDFYELFHEDAQIAAKVLGLTLTSRDKGSANPVPMAGFPYHALEGYLRKLISSGHKAAICEQVEDPKTAKGMVRREVTRIVTPGTLTDEALLDPRRSNFLAAVCPFKDRVGIAWLELSTGKFQCVDVEQKDDAGALGSRLAFLDELARIEPAECLVPDHIKTHPVFTALMELDGPILTERPAWSFAAQHCKEILLGHFGTKTLEGFDLSDEDTCGITAAGALLEYVQETQKTSLGHIVRLEPYRQGTNLLIDETTRRSLELTRTQREGQRDGSLVSVLDETCTPMGARLLMDWLSNPLTDRLAIERRLDAVEELVRDSRLCRELRELLGEAYDLQRLSARVATLRASPRDLSSLAKTLALLPRLKAKLAGRTSDLLKMLDARLELCAEVRAEIESTLVDEPPLSATEGGIVRVGRHAGLDELRDLAQGGKKWIAEYQAKQIERTGISSMKVGFNKVFGYYLEVTAVHMHKVPTDYIRKQTLKNLERFITPELKEYEERVLRAEGQSQALEQELFQDLRNKVGSACPQLQQTAEVLAVLDVLASLATLAGRQGYCRPVIVDEPCLEIREGRHPVLDRLKPAGEFVPNDAVLGISLDGSDKPAPIMALITGPNMAGKSTYIRQAALLTILAQMGSFLPAGSARIGVADRIFARVGASDELGKGQSTFMVEMTETARILNTATNRSLVILDEIGRGTSTYDGISLAWAITEYLHDHVGCRTLFATHYHELTELPQTMPRVCNWNVAVHEENGDVVFLHKIVPGAADRSYGIHVARLAGVPREVLTRANVILSTLETDHHDEVGKMKIPARKRQNSRQLSLFVEPEHPLLDELRDMKLDELTPLAALQALHKLQGKLK